MPRCSSCWSTQRLERRTRPKHPKAKSEPYHQQIIVTRLPRPRRELGLVFGDKQWLPASSGEAKTSRNDPPSPQIHHGQTPRAPRMVGRSRHPNHRRSRTINPADPPACSLHEADSMVLARVQDIQGQAVQIPCRSFQTSADTHNSILDRRMSCLIMPRKPNNTNSETPQPMLVLDPLSYPPGPSTE